MQSLTKQLLVLWLAMRVVSAVDVGEVPPDFSLRDQNLASNRQAGMVSPRDYLLQVSGYYFGDAG